ncbi:MAG: hypothetical protein ACOZJX_05260 [Pseudomonadota bacterium]
MKALAPSGLLPLAVDEGATTPAPTHTAVVWSTLLGCVMYWDGQRWTAGAGGRQMASAGLRMAIIGASTEARAHPMWSGTAAQYQRVSGVVTVTVDYILANYPMLPGKEIRIGCGNRPDVEGRFAITSCSVAAGSSMTITYPDARPDVAAGTLGGGIDLHDVSCYTVSGGFPAHLNLCMGGRLELEVIATSGTNLVTDWGDARVDQLVARGHFDVILIGTGVIGNTINAFGAGPAVAFSALKTLIEKLRDRCAPRLVLVETPSASRTITPASSVYTTAQALLRRMWTELPRLYPFVRVVPCSEAMIQNYSAHNAAPSEDVANGWPELAALADDGVHAAYPWSAVRGEVLADTLLRHMAPHISPEMGVLPDTNLVNTALDPDGGKNRNYAQGLWGNVAGTQVTISSTGCSGVAPAGSAISFTAGRGTSTAVSALSTNPRGGTRWAITIDGKGSASGYTLQADRAPSWLLDMLNDPAVQGKYLDWFTPLSVQCGDLKLIYADVKLMATAGGVEYTLAAPLANQGQFHQAGILRGMDAGFAGVLRAPRFKVPIASFTAASIRVTVKEVNGSVASGRTVVTWEAGERFHLID